jgi:hypothetical protein
VVLLRVLASVFLLIDEGASSSGVTPLVDIGSALWEYKRALVEVERSSTHIWMMAGKLKRHDESRAGVALPYTNGAL